MLTPIKSFVSFPFLVEILLPDASVLVQSELVILHLLCGCHLETAFTFSCRNLWFSGSHVSLCLVSLLILLGIILWYLPKEKCVVEKCSSLAACCFVLG